MDAQWRPRVGGASVGVAREITIQTLEQFQCHLGSGK